MVELELKMNLARQIAELELKMRNMPLESLSLSKRNEDALQCVTSSKIFLKKETQVQSSKIL